MCLCGIMQTALNMELRKCYYVTPMSSRSMAVCCMWRAETQLALGGPYIQHLHNTSTIPAQHRHNTSTTLAQHLHHTCTRSRTLDSTILYGKNQDSVHYVLYKFSTHVDELVDMFQPAINLD